MTARDNFVRALFIGSTLVATPPFLFAQAPIRIETNEVLIPVTVVDSDRYTAWRENLPELFRALGAGDIKRANDIDDAVLVKGLTPNDFRVLEDGKQQNVSSVVYEQSLFWNFRDNGGYHTELVGAGGGRWSIREWPPNTVGEYWPAYYIVSYIPQDNLEGSCHHLEISVNRPRTLVLARGDYCTNKHLDLYPLNGSVFGSQIGRDLAVNEKSTIEIAAVTATLFAEDKVTRGHITVEWPWKSLVGRLDGMGISGTIFKKDGSVEAQFNDVFDWPTTHKDRRFGSLKAQDFPVRYETQVLLAPGEYQLQIAVGDGTKFGRLDQPLTVESLDAKSLALSVVSICKQIQDATAYSGQVPPKSQGSWTTSSSRNYAPLISNGIEFKPTTNPRFQRSQSVYYFFEVSDPILLHTPQGTVDIQVRILDLKTGDVKSDPELISAMPYQKPGNAVIAVGRGVRIDKLAIGSYRLDVRAIDSAGQRTDWRSANFSVE